MIYMVVDFFEKNYLSFGNGGGYVGVYMVYYMLENG